MTVTLHYDYFGAAKAGETRHAEVVLKSLRITWQGFVGQPITDSIIVRGCSNVPETLPPFISVGQ